LLYIVKDGIPMCHSFSSSANSFGGHKWSPISSDLSIIWFVNVTLFSFFLFFLDWIGFLYWDSGLVAFDSMEWSFMALILMGLLKFPSFLFNRFEFDFANWFWLPVLFAMWRKFRGCVQRSGMWKGNLQAFWEWHYVVWMRLRSRLGAKSFFSSWGLKVSSLHIS